MIWHPKIAMTQFKTETGGNVNVFQFWLTEKSVADFWRTKAGKSAQNSVADFGNSVAEFGLHYLQEQTSFHSKNPIFN